METHPLPAQLIRLVGVPDLNVVREHLRNHSTPPGISNPFASVADLQTFRQGLDMYFSLFSPIRRLPEDVLYQIFQHHAQSAPGGRDHFRDRASHAPVRALAQVCAFWRAVVINSPSLWTQIDVRAIEEVASRSGADAASKVVSLGLENSRGGPLDVRLQRCSRSSLEILPMYLQRAKHLHLTTLQHPEEVKYLSTICANNVPQLRDLRITGTSLAVGVLSGAHLRAVDWTASAVNLRRLSVSGSLIAQIPPQVLGRLASLECTVYVPELDESVSILQSIQAGVHYSLVFYPTFFPNDYNDTTVQIKPTTSSITRLTLAAGGLNHRPHGKEQTTQVFSKIMRALMLSTLQGLSFEGAPANDGQAPMMLPWPHAAFLDLGFRSQFSNHLLSLDLVGVDISAVQLDVCLQHLRSLQSLAIADPDQKAESDTENKTLVSTPLLNRLAETQPTIENPIVAAPSLTELRMYSKLEFTDWSLAMFLRARAMMIGRKKPFTCHIYVRGKWTEVTDARRKMVWQQTTDLRHEGRLKMSFSSESRISWSAS